MNIFEFPVKRPVTTIMLMCVFVVLGVISLIFLKIELIPKLTFPNLMVITEYPGAGPLEIEKSVTRPLETAIRSVSGIKNVKSNSAEGISVVNSEFNWGQNLDEATNQIRDRIGRIRNYLPKDVKDPIIYSMDTGNIPVLVLGFRADAQHKIDVEMINKFCKDNIQPKLEKAPGVSTVYIMGGRDREIQVNCDRQKLYAYGLSLNQVIAKVGMENLTVSAGNIEDTGEMQFLVRGEGEFKKPEEINNIIVGMKNNIPVYLKDIAKVEDTYSDEIGKSRINDLRSISVIVMKESDANTVDTAKNVRIALKNMQREFPEGLDFQVVFDTSEMISDSINALKSSALEGAIFAALIIFIFLGRINPTLIICISIPISLFLAFTAMYFTKTTINIMTLGGLVIALGRLVDDSVVVMENIFRRRQLGEDAYTAAVEGTKEVSIPVISSTLVTVIVFLPILFAQGMAVQLFKDFGATVFYALCGSLIVAFTIVPMLASRLFRKGVEKYDAESTTIYDRFKKFYGKTLGYALSHKGLVLGIAGILILITLGLFAIIGKNFLPSFVSGKYQIMIKLPKGSTLEATDKLMKRVETGLKTGLGDDLETLSSNVGTSSMARAMRGTTTGVEGGQIMVSLKKGKRKTTEGDLYDILDRIQKENKGGQVNLSAAGGGMFGSGRPVEVKIYGEDLDLLKKLGDDLLNKIKDIKGIKAATSSMEQGLPEFSLKFNRDKLAKYGLSVAQVGTELTAAIDGTTASIYREAGEESNIQVRLSENYRKSFSDMLEIPISSPQGFVFPLKDIVEATHAEGPSQVDRENAKRLVDVSADVSGRSLSAVVQDVRKVLNKIYLPQGYFYEFGGQEQDRIESFLTLGATLLMAILLIYMILASLYESFIHPFTIMLSVPFAFTGAMIALFITGTALGVTALIGFIMLVGIVATNAIVLIDFIIKRREVEKDRRKAIIDAAETRLRPILITAIATVVALLPIAIGWHEGMDMEIPMGIAVIGGLFASTFLTLFIIPIVYEIFDSLSKRKNQVIG